MILPAPLDERCSVRHFGSRGDGEAVFVVEPEVDLRESFGLNVRELARAEDLIDDNLELIKQEWTEHLG